MSRRRTREPCLPAAAALAGGITSAHREPLPSAPVYDHPRLLTAEESEREWHRLEREEIYALYRVRGWAEALLVASASGTTLLCEARAELREAIEASNRASAAAHDHVRRPVA